MKYIITCIFCFLISSLLVGQDALFSHFGKEEGLKSNHIYDISEDKNGRIWVATSKGLTYLEGLGFETPVNSQTIGNAIVIGFFSNGQIHGCYTSDGKIFLIKEKKIQPIALNSKLVDLWVGKIVNQAKIDDKNNIWVSSLIGDLLIEIQPENRKIIEHNLTGNFNYFARKVSDDTYITGSSNSTEKQQNQLKVFFKNLELDVPLNGSTSFNKSDFLKLKNTSYLFTVGDELINFDKKGIKARLFTEKKVECTFEDSEQKIWVGILQGGAICFPTGDITSRNRIEYLSNKTVTSIFEDSQNGLWFSTSNSGIFHYNLNSNITYTAPKMSIVFSDSSRPIEAIRIDNIADELSLIENTESDTTSPKIYISSVKINSKDTTLSKNYTLQANQNFIRFSFVGSLAGYTNLFQYRYKLSGVDKEWVYSSSSYTQYTMLPPGSYVFEVEAMRRNGIWSKSSAKVQIHIKPHYYQTLWFKFLIALIIVSLLLLFLWLYLISTRKKQEQKVEVNKRIANLELKALRAQMNPHFIFNTLSSIQHFITDNNSENALKYLSKFAKLMRVILDNSKKRYISITDEVKAISLYLELEKLRFKNKFDYEIDIDPSIDQAYEEVPSMLVQPYIENAILHGIANKKTKGTINIRIYLENKHLVCCVEDDGIGREKARELNKQKNQNHIPQGMSITKNRLHIINKVNDSNLTTIIEDVYPKKRDETGTRVKIYIALNQE